MAETLVLPWVSGFAIRSRFDYLLKRGKFSARAKLVGPENFAFLQFECPPAFLLRLRRVMTGLAQWLPVRFIPE